MAQEKKDNRELYFAGDVTQAMLEGSTDVYKAVTKTFGPKGENVLIEMPYGRPKLTRDGVTVAREVYFSKRDKNAVAQVIVEASQTTNRVAGDGTTATAAFTYHLIKHGLQHQAAGKSKMDIKKEIVDSSYLLLEELEKLSKPLKKGQLKQVATISAGDENIGTLIAEAVEYVGAEGGIITEKAPITDIDREYVDGYYMQQGFTAIDTGKKTVEQPYVVVSAKLLTSGIDALEIINKVGMLAHAEEGTDMSQPLQNPIRIAFFGEIEGEAYQTIVANIVKGIFDGVIVKTPPMGDMGVQFLEDLATYTGAQCIAPGENLSSVTTDYIGRAQKVTCSVSDTVIFGGAHIKEDLDKRIADLKDRIKEEEIDAIAEKLRDRKSRLENKIARFRIGGATDTEKEELEYRVEDSIQAARAAASHGVVFGGGTTLVALSKLEGISPIVRDALQATFKQLVANADLPVDVKLQELLSASYGQGFNLRKNGELVDLEKEGILDPTLVVEQIIKNATSSASSLMTVGCIITFTDKKDA